MYNGEEYVIFEIISLDGRHRIISPIPSNMTIGRLSMQLAQKQGIGQFSHSLYVVADAHSGKSYENPDLPVTHIPEFSSIRLIPTRAARGNRYRLKRYSVLYIAWFLLNLMIFIGALTREPESIFAEIGTFTWVFWLIMLAISGLTAVVGFFSDDDIYVRDINDFQRRLIRITKNRGAIATGALIFTSLICVTSIQFGADDFLSSIGSFLVTLVVGVIAIFAGVARLVSLSDS